MKHNSAALAHMLASGSINDEARAWLSAGFNAWLRDDGSMGLERYLGLPSKPEGVRRAIRNHWLREAAVYLAIPDKWECARLLKAEMDYFKFRIWPRCGGSRIPPMGSQLHGMLYLALQSGATMPATLRQFYRIVSDTDTRARVTAPSLR